MKKKKKFVDKLKRQMNWFFNPKTNSGYNSLILENIYFKKKYLNLSIKLIW